jgi:hypothetical protein
MAGVHRIDSRMFAGFFVAVHIHTGHRRVLRSLLRGWRGGTLLPSGVHHWGVVTGYGSEKHAHQKQRGKRDASFGEQM